MIICHPNLLKSLNQGKKSTYLRPKPIPHVTHDTKPTNAIKTAKPTRHTPMHFPSRSHTYNANYTTKIVEPSHSTPMHLPSHLRTHHANSTTKKDSTTVTTSLNLLYHSAVSFIANTFSSLLDTKTSPFDPPPNLGLL